MRKASPRRKSHRILQLEGSGQAHEKAHSFSALKIAYLLAGQAR